MLARSLSANEESKLRSSGIRFATQFLCYDAVAIVVHPENQVKELSIDQLRKIFSGEFPTGVSWEDLIWPWRSWTWSANQVCVLSCPRMSLEFPLHQAPAVVTSPNKVPDEVGRRKGAIGYCRTQLALSSDKSDRIKPLANKIRSVRQRNSTDPDNVRTKAYPNHEVIVTVLRTKQRHLTQCNVMWSIAQANWQTR